MDTQMDENDKQHDVQHVVHAMTTCKAHEVLPRRCRMEREVVSGEEVIYETHEIAHRVRDIQVNPKLQQKIDAIVDGGSNNAVDTEPHELPRPVLLLYRLHDFPNALHSLLLTYHLQIYTLYFRTAHIEEKKLIYP